ncbi:glutathione S-transferase [Cupriavidus sp. USMAA2-4]|uniref:glutathione S-transferase family protein n=1 Tax=Cupriavidus sp. USMAA2-4 TaxID=876364 RepID=UPI0008A6A92D|nr:glutathione S-transferase [Cupriavidus sp. USMAA2-4]AOY95445.1 glutathione S-transferase [Cupriavidus sp. USMAA2-4]
MLQILGKASSINVRKVLWTCVELDLAFTREDWGSGFRATSAPEFLALNPNAMVPVIRDGDFTLWESNTILRYLANREHAIHLYPTAAAARARVDQWMDWQATDLNRSWSYAFLALARRDPDYQDPEQIARSSAAWARHMAIVEGQLERTGGFIAGASFTLADIPIGLSINRWLETPLAHEGFPATLAYMERMGSRRGFVEYCRNGTP